MTTAHSQRTATWQTSSWVKWTIAIAAILIVVVAALDPLSWAPSAGRLRGTWTVDRAALEAFVQDLAQSSPQLALTWQQRVQTFLAQRGDLRLTVQDDHYELLDGGTRSGGPCTITTRSPNILILRNTQDTSFLSFSIGLQATSATRFPGQLVLQSDQLPIPLHKEAAP